MKHLMWFRADLRTIDNTALTAAQYPLEFLGARMRALELPLILS